MASNRILNDLWEIAQKNTNDEIDEMSFKNDVSNSIYSELKKSSDEISNIDNEFDRVLPIILKQAEINPHVLGEVKGGSFAISSNIIVSAVKNVKYENQFIPGTVEYDQRNLTNRVDLKDIILTATIIDCMIKNYKDLSGEERNKLINAFPDMTYDEKKNFIEANHKLAKELSNSRNLPQEVRERAEEIGKRLVNSGKVLEALEKEDMETARELFAENPEVYESEIEEFCKKHQIPLDEFSFQKINDRGAKEIVDVSTQNDINNVNTIKILEDLISGTKEDIKNIIDGFDKNEKNFNDLKKILKEIGFDITDINDLRKKIEAHEFKFSKKNFKIENSKVDIISNTEQNDEMIKEKLAKSLVGIQDAINMGLNQSKTNVTAKAFSSKEDNKYKVVRFKEQDILEALIHYKEYFKDFDDEIVEAISEMTPEEIIANIKDDFDDMQNEGEITKDTRKALDIMLESITERTKDILLDRDKRKTFFEKLQSDLTSQKDTELISESEISELFERIGLELQVAPFELAREDDVVQAQQSRVASDYRAAIENTELDEMFIKDGILMKLDETLTEVAMEAQDKGEDIEKAIIEYQEKQELENARNNHGQKEEYKENRPQPEIIVVEDEQEYSQSESLVEDALEMSGEVIEDVQSESNLENSKDVIVVKKGKERDIQVFRPIPFLRKSSLRFDQIKQEQMDLTRVVVAAREEENELNSSNKNNFGKDNLMIH